MTRLHPTRLQLLFSRVSTETERVVRRRGFELSFYLRLCCIFQSASVAPALSNLSDCGASPPSACSHCNRSTCFMEGWHEYSLETYVHVNIHDLPDYAVLLLLPKSRCKLASSRLHLFSACSFSTGRIQVWPVWIRTVEMSDAPKQERVGGSV